MLLAITSCSSIIWLVYAFRFSEQQGQEPIVLKNLTVAKLFFSLNAAIDELSASATISLVVRNACEIRIRRRGASAIGAADFRADGATRDQTFGFFRGSNSRTSTGVRK